MKTLKPKDGFFIALEEFKSMRATLISGNALLFSAAALLCVFFKADFRYFTGILIGNILSAGYFLSLGWSSGYLLSKKRVNSSKNGKSASNLANALYGVRYAGLFALCCVFLGINLVNLFFLILPLFFVKTHYTLSLFKKPKRSGYEECAEYTGGDW